MSKNRFHGKTEAEIKEILSKSLKELKDTEGSLIGKMAKNFFELFDNLTDNNLKIKVNYDGKWPKLCRGRLVVLTEERDPFTKETDRHGLWVFPEYCLVSRGGCNWRTGDIRSGKWSICEWPKGFPEYLKEPVLEAVNDQIEHGCCGGCL